jgi:outer membrane protein assembly factor BamB
MKTFNRAVLTTLLLSFLSGCALFSKDDQGPEPSPLVKFDEQVKLVKQWSAKVGDGIGARYVKLTPAVDGQVIYAADAAGIVAAFDRETGKRQWRVKLNENLSGGVGAGYGMVFVGTESGHLLALSQKDGSSVWRVAVSSEILSAPKTNARLVVVQTLDEKVYAFDHKTGEHRWQYESNTPALSLRGTSSPILTPELALVGLGNGQVVALQADTGSLLWKQRATVPQGRSEFERMTDVDGDLLLAGSTLYATSFQGFVVAIDVNSGRPLWRKPLSSFQGPDEALGNLFVSAADDHVYAFDQATSEEAWVQKSLEHRTVTAPTAFANYLAVADDQGYLHLMTQNNGQFVARKKVDGDGVRTRPLAKGNLLYVYGNSGKLVALTIK